MGLEDTTPESLTSAEPPEVPGYRVIAPVGAGSRGAVFRARDLRTQEVVALKIIELREARSAGEGGGTPARAIEGAVERLARVASDVLVKPLKAVTLGGGGRIALVMELVDGDSLGRQLGRSVRLVPARAVRIAAEVARGLGSAFDAGFVHGSLHPGKIIATERCARLLGAGLGEALPSRFETPGASGRVAPHVYAADEVLAGDPPSAASDVYSLGAVLYHMLTGHPPWDPPGLAALRVARADGPPVWPRGSSELMPASVMGLVDRMTSRDPVERPAGGWMLAGALESAFKKRGRRERRKVAPVLEEPPADVALADVSPGGKVEAGVAASPLAGILRRMREQLRRPSSIRVVVGGATAVFLLAVALALRAPREGGAPRRDAGRGKAEEEGAPAVRTAGPTSSTSADAKADDGGPPAATGETAASPALREMRSIEALLAESPGDVAVFRERLEVLRSETGEVGVRATLLLARLTESEEERAKGALRRLTDRAAALEGGGRYGEAVAALEQFPFDSFAGTAAADGARLAADAVRGRAAEAFAEVERGTAALLAKGDYAAARAEFAYLRDTMGLPAWVERSEQMLTRIGRMEEDAAAAEAVRREAERTARLADEVEGLLAELPRLCGEFRYSKAERAIEALLARPIMERDKNRLGKYAGYVRREAEQFRLTAARVRSGESVLRVSFRGMARDLVVRDVTEEGLELSGLDTEGSMTTQVGWRRFGGRFPYELMLKAAKATAFDERIALAVFAYHRNLPTEVENELRVAGMLAESRRARSLLEGAREFLKIDPFAE